MKPAWIDYVNELRQRLLLWLAVTIILFCVFVYGANALYKFIAIPLLDLLPSTQNLIATNVITPLFTPLKLAWLSALLVSLPFLFYQLWRFIAPALYHSEKRWLWPLISLSVLLFYGGIGFAYWIVLPLVFKFITHFVPHYVALMPDMNQYLNFVTQLLLAFGVVFQVPVVIIALTLTGMVSLAAVKKQRRYVVVGAFIIGMLLTPPDVVSQILLAIPIWLLFEIGIVLATWLLLSFKKPY
ncbi:MAG: twin-arginine translocase subunit TatC [Gammaproteobacteria bacterium]